MDEGIIILIIMIIVDEDDDMIMIMMAMLEITENENNKRIAKIMITAGSNLGGSLDEARVRKISSTCTKKKIRSEYRTR
jgi:uncharacterized membrane protein